MSNSQDGRKTVHLKPERHDKVVDAAFHDGRINLTQWVAEAIDFYLDRSAATRASFRRKRKRREVNEA